MTEIKNYSTKQSVGICIDLDPEELYVLTKLRIYSSDLDNNWERCSITSDFLAQYHSSFFSLNNFSNYFSGREDAEFTFSFIINELLENAAKYSDISGKYVELVIALDDNKFIISISNEISERNFIKFAKVSKEILEKDTQEMYLQKIGENYSGNKTGSGVGYLTMINDYGISFCFAFNKIKSGLVQSTVKATLNFDEEL